jgi:5-methylcytosine-specific restriction enzyme B
LAFGRLNKEIIMSELTVLWQQFLEAYPQDDLTDIQLEQYTDLNKDNAFIYWLEVRTSSLGGIGGGSAFKFGIYCRNSDETKANEKGRCYNDDYAWYEKYGETQDSAWAKVKSILLEIVNAAQSSDLDSIDAVKFSESVKWKIAFLYQDQTNYSVLNIFKHEALVYLCEKIGVKSAGKKSQLSYPEAYSALLNHYKDEAITDLFALAAKLWREWEQREEQAVIEESKAVQQHWIIPLQSMLLDYGDVAYYDYVSPENYPDGFTKFLEDIEFTKSDKLALCDENNILAIGQVDELQQSGAAWVQTPQVFSLPLSAAPSEIRLLTPAEIADIWGAYELARPKPKAQNIILYGPPGTGKTYSVIERALKLILSEEAFVAIKGDQQKMHRRFSELQTKGQIEFVTFHQSYSYEEFVEGLRPVLEEELTSEVRYEIHNGILKRIAEKAETTGIISQKGNRWEGLLNESPTVWKISLKANDIEGIKEDCFNKGVARIGWDNAGDLISDNPSEEEQQYREKLGAKNQNTLDNFSTGIRTGDIIISLKDQKTSDAIGIVTKPYYYNNTVDEANNYIDVDWIYRGDIDVYELNGQNYLVQQTVYKLSRIKPADILGAIPQEMDESSLNKITGISKQFVLIIDEINRGNLSKIFGELITLLEPGKRIGQAEALKLRLPYSNEEFSLPSNLHVIGTMNTADRSIALMDVALRRRFQFEELMPDADVIRDALDRSVPDSAFVHLVVNVFETLNKRIRFLYDRDHQLGHAYFLDVKNYRSFKKVMTDRVLPLLQEYFYGSWEKICLVLGCPYDDETGQLQRNATHLHTTNTYVAPLIKAVQFDEESTLGFDHDDYHSQIEYEVNPAFINSKDERIILFFLNTLELDATDHAEKLTRLQATFNRLSRDG